MSQAMVSVLITTYNTEKFVESAISSIMQQTYKNLEIVIVDDASTDKTFHIVSQLQQKDKRIMLYRNERNFGAAYSSNKGLDNCNGDYVARMDSDDIAVNTRITLQVKFMEANRDIAGCGTWGRSFGNKGGLMKCPLEDKQIRAYFPFNSPIIHPSFVIRHSFMKEYSLRYNPRFQVAIDYELLDRILQYGRLANIPKVLLFYRKREGQLSGQGQRIKVVQSAQVVRRRHINRFFHENNIDIQVPPVITTETIQGLRKLKLKLPIINTILHCFFLSLPKYTIRTLALFLTSFVWIRFPYTPKEFARVIYKHIKPSRFLSWL